MSPSGPESYEFGPFRLDAGEGRLLREGRSVPLKPKTLETLLVLVRHAGHAVGPEELRKTLWPDTVVSEANLRQNIWMLREALEEKENEARYVETVPKRGYRFVAPVTRVPEEGQGPRQRQGREGRDKKRSWLSLAAVVVLVLVASAIGPLVASRRTPGPAASALKPRRSVAVLGFKNLSGRPEAAWLSTALGEMLSMELAAGERLRTVPGESVARMKVDLSLGEAETLARDTLHRIRRNLGTDLVVLGAYVALGEQGGKKIRVDVRIQDAVTGDVVAAATGAGAEGDVLALVSDVGARLRERLGVGGLSPSDAAAVRASFPTSDRAVRLYAEGLAKLRVFDALAARHALEKAVAAAPEHALLHSALAAAWTALGHDERAKAEAKRAFELSQGLSREDVLLVEARYRETTREWAKAIDLHRALWTFFPDNLEYGLRLSDAHRAAGQGTAAIATLQILRRLPAPASEDPRIDLQEAATAESLADYRRCRDAAATAAQKGTALGARLLVARARLQEGRALRWQGELGKAAAAAQEAKQIFAEVGDRAGVARSLNLFGMLLSHQGDLPKARVTYEEILAISREIGNKDLTARALNNIADDLRQQGNLREARGRYEEAVGLFREIGDKALGAVVLSHIAELLLAEGDLVGANRISEQCLAIGREINDKHLVGHGLYNIAEALRLRGDLAGARKMYEESLSIRRGIGNRIEAAESLYGLGDLLAAQGDVAAARRTYEEALALRNEIGARSAVAGTRLALATLLAEERRIPEAEALARQAADQLQKEGRSDKEAAAHALLARCLVEQGALAEARKAIERAIARSIRSQSFELRLAVAITAARVEAASGRRAEAIQTLEGVLSESTRAGVLGLQFEARLALGEIEPSGGSGGASRSGLLALEAEARSKGFGLVARRASVAVASVATR